MFSSGPLDLLYRPANNSAFLLEFFISIAVNDKYFLINCFVSQMNGNIQKSEVKKKNILELQLGNRSLASVFKLKVVHAR